MSKPSYDTLMKLLLIGSSSVGKTCLLVKYVEDSFNSSFISTIGIDFKIKTIELRGKRIKLQIWDTAGQERFKTITVSYYRGAMGILLIYDITNKNSFNEVGDWLETIKKNAGDKSCVILVGSKCDLEDKREVNYEDGAALAKQNNALFIETSAKTGHNVNEAFQILTEQILDSQPIQSEPRHPHGTANVGSNQNSQSNACC